MVSILEKIIAFFLIRPLQTIFEIIFPSTLTDAEAGEKSMKL